MVCLESSVFVYFPIYSISLSDAKAFDFSFTSSHSLPLFGHCCHFSLPPNQFNFNDTFFIMCTVVSERELSIMIYYIETQMHIQELYHHQMSCNNKILSYRLKLFLAGGFLVNCWCREDYT